MKNVVLSSVISLAALSIGSASYACDMHGAGGYGSFGMKFANWQSYEPRVSMTDPAFEEDFLTSIPTDMVPQAKAKPSFSNAATMAAFKAKSRLAKKEDSANFSEEAKETVVKKAELNADS